MHRNSKNTRNTDDSLGSGTKVLLPSCFFQSRRERHNFYYADYSIWPAHDVDPTGLASPRLENQFASPRSECQLPLFSKITQNPQPIISGHDVIHIFSLISYPGVLLWRLWLSHPSRASVNTCAQCVPLPVH